MTAPAFPIIADGSYAVYREPFKLGTPHVKPIRPGATLADIVRDLDVLPPDFTLRGVIMINGHMVPIDLWSRVRPKPDKAIVTFHLPVQGGGGGGQGGGGKQVLAIVAALALTVISAGIASGALGAALGISALATPGLATTLLAAGVSLAGSLLINALISPPSRAADSVDSSSSRGARSLQPASISGNVLEPNAPIPRVIGTRRIFPPFAFEPLIELIGQDEFVTGVYVLAGAHAVDQPRIGDAALDLDAEDADVTLEIDDGTPSGERISVPDIYSRTFPINVEMSVHSVNENNLSLFDGTLPVWHPTITAEAPDECWIHLLSAGMISTGQPTERIRVPIRIRLRKRGDVTWRYLPELHYEDNTQSQRRMQVKFIFGETFTSTPIQPNATLGWVMARKMVPAQSVAPVGVQWDADSYFSNGAGSDVYSNATHTTTNIINMNMSPETATFYLDSAEWEPGIYEIELIRGSAFLAGNFTDSNYQYSGNVLDFFGSRSTLSLPLTRDGLVDRIQLVRAVSVRRQRPIDAKNLTVIRVTARNRAIDNLSVRASGYVSDWDAGSETWTDYKITSNPAPHYRDILSGLLNFDPLPEIMHDEQTLLDWRQACIDNDYRCDLVVESGTLSEVLRIVASCGYARPYQSELWGIMRDYDRTNEAPVQIFTPRNMSGFQWQKAFPRLPTGFRVNFRDDEHEYTGKQIMVYRPGQSETDARVEQISYEGLVRKADVIKRARYDLLNGQHRAAIYSFTAPAESIVCRRGSLVGINHDILLKQYGFARIVEVIVDSSDDVIAVRLDAKVQTYGNDDMTTIADMLQVTDMLQVGLQTGVAIRQSDGDITVHALSAETAETDTLEFATPIATDQIEVGNLVAIGLIGKEYKRMIVSEIAPSRDLTARITCVDEAPEIWAALAA